MSEDAPVMGMLYAVSVRLVNRVTRETTKHKLLLVGRERADVERKIAWLFDARVYQEIVILEVEKFRDKVYFLSTVITQEHAPVKVIERDERSQVVNDAPVVERDSHFYAVGVVTTMYAADEGHALRKVGSALIANANGHGQKFRAQLSEDSTITVEEIARPSNLAKARDVSCEKNRATMVRG